MGLLSIFKARHERAGFALYGAAVAAAREPVYFVRLEVADTLDGRFDLVALFAALLIRRLRGASPPGAELAQAVFDAMFADMDFNLREMGLGDKPLATRMKQMWEAFHGRALAYEAALAAGDAGGLAAALGRNVWRGAPPAGAAELLAQAAMAQDRHLAAVELEDFRTGQARFLPAAETLP
jgi:cytochrome b pre-mRNA-processing protein 3